MTATSSTYVNALKAIAAGELSLSQTIEAASALGADGQTANARQIYRLWYKANEDHALAHVALFNKSALDAQAGEPEEAIQALKLAIARTPDFLPAYINLGGLVERSGDPLGAVEIWRSATIRPLPVNGGNVSYVTTALRQMARVLNDLQHVEAAEAAIAQCLEIAPGQSDAIEQYLAFRLAQCKWPASQAGGRLDQTALLGNVHPLSMAVFTDDPLLQLANAARYASSAPVPASTLAMTDRRFAQIDLSSRRLRVGYVSSDLRDHAIGYLMAEFFELQDRGDVEVFAYYCGQDSGSALTNRIKSAVEHWRDIRMVSDENAAQMIAQDGIDILVDVNGHTRDARAGVFALWPAPVLVNWLGYPGTMGSAVHHYIVADDIIIPKDFERYYSERVVRLPCYQPNDRKRVVAATPSKAGVGLPGNAFVFCCFNGVHKISKFTFARWMDILSQTPGSVLWLLEPSAGTKTRLRQLAEAAGVSGERIIFAPKMPNPAHMARYRLADLFLDTSPYGAHTTASDALWMGVPVVTMIGRAFASRVCASLVTAAGTPGTVTASPQEYVARAVALAKDDAELNRLKKALETNRLTCTLFDTDLLVTRLNALFHEMAAEHRYGCTPKPRLEGLGRYQKAGLDIDHEAQETGAVADYEGMYLERLALQHLASPLAPDDRLWTEAAIVTAEREFARRMTGARASTVARHPELTGIKRSA